MDGKLEGLGHLNAVFPGQLLHLQDDFSNRRFLIDTGAAYSVFPHKSSEAPLRPLLRGPSGQPIACWGKRCISVSFSGRPFERTFLLVEVRFPLLGADFLHHHGLVVDLAAGWLIQPPTLPLFASASSSALGSGLLAPCRPFRSLSAASSASSRTWCTPQACHTCKARCGACD
jgi:hypothetical protein